MTDYHNTRPPARPLLRYHGGKWRLGPWIISHFPEHTYYAEPFGGSASVLLQKPRCYGEHYNDLYGDVVTLFRVLQDPRGRDQLAERVRLTPFARQEFELAFERTDSHGDLLPALEIARRLLIRSHMGFGSASYLHSESTGFRQKSRRAGTLPSHDWLAMPEIIRQTAARFEGVVIDSRDAFTFIEDHDEEDVLFYVDPPYVPSTRASNRFCYVHEMSDDDHIRLLDLLTSLRGMVVLSGYASTLYRGRLPSWRCTSKTTSCNGNVGSADRTECLWLNEAAQQNRQLDVFDDGTWPVEEAA